jgi:osmotically-inducible protein OsmY
MLADALILARANARLAQEFGDFSRQHDFEIKVVRGQITLYGATTDPNLIVRALRALQSVEGVASVESQAQVIEFVPHYS